MSPTQRAALQADVKQRQEAAAKDRAAAEAAAKEKEAAAERLARELKTMPEADAVERINALGTGCDNSACVSQALDEAAFIRANVGGRARLVRKVDKATAKLKDLAQTLGQRDGLIAIYTEHMKICCDVPKFMHSRAEKAQCIEWGFKKCVSDEE